MKKRSRGLQPMQVMMSYIKSGTFLGKFTLHPLIHTFGPKKDTTTCGGGSERARVWIKVCNMQFQGTDASFRY